MTENNQHEERRGFVRLPLVLFVDSIEFDPDIFHGRVVRTAYDLDIQKEDAKRLYEALGKKLQNPLEFPIRIRVIGRLVS